MSGQEVKDLGQMESKNNSIFTPIRLLAAILILVIIYLVHVWARWHYLGLPDGDARFLSGIGGATATIGLATVILYQGHLYRKSLQEARKSRLIQQESKWIPEVRQPMRWNWLLFSNPRPWYPWFKAEVNGKQSGWAKETVRLLPESGDGTLDVNSGENPNEASRNLKWHERLAQTIEDEDVDWYIPFPQDIIDFLGDWEPDIYAGKLYFRFKTITDGEYFFIYYIEFIVGEEGYRIRRTPYVNRIMPWDESDLRNELQTELNLKIEESRELDAEARKKYIDGWESERDY